MSYETIMMNPYSGNFHLLRHQETRYAADRILSILLRQVPNIHSAVDVGCGVGTFLSILKKHGINDILGLDGDWVDHDMLVIPRSNFQSVNLRTLPNLGKRYDLAICLEVAEHLPAEDAERFISWLCGLSDIILFSAAVPRQGGVNHLNEAWQSYWANLFARHGFYHIDLIRPQIWKDQAIPFWYRQNILVYAKEWDRFSSNQSCSFPLDLIHPELYLMRSDDSYRSGLLQRLIRRLKIFVNRSKVMPLKFTSTNLLIRVYDRVVKKGLLNTLVYSARYVYSRARLLVVIPNDLKNRIAERTAQIKHGLTVYEIRARTLKYIESMRQQGKPYGRYKYAACQQKPILYASVYAALTRHLYGDLAGLTAQERGEWIGYIKSFQCEDGLFRDPEVDCELADSVAWWGWRHLTFHAVMALACLGGVADNAFKFLESFKNDDFIESWLNDMHITQYPSPQMNVHLPLCVVALLQYARDYQGMEWANSSVRKIIGLLDLQQDPKTGCWCTGNGRSDLINEGVKIAYHLWVFYFYDKYLVKHLEVAIDSLLSTQNKFGGFDYSANSSACDDIDSIDPLCRMTKLTQYRKNDIKNALYRAVPWVLANMNQDGGFVFKRGESFQYGHEKMYSGMDESNMFATWFRTLSLAYIGKCLPDSWLGEFDWHFEKIPGLQFWHD